MTKPIVAFTILRTRLIIRATFKLLQFCVDEISQCVLQTAVASVQSPGCDTEWLICVNVVILSG